MTYSNAEIWGLILAMGTLTYLIRFSFLGLLGGRELPPLLLRLLRYTPVAVLPGLVAPLVAVPDAPADPLRLVAAAVTILVGWRTKSLLWAIAAGVAIFYGGRYLSTPVI